MQMATDQNFNQAVSGPLTLVKFGAPWCQPCRALEPLLHQLEGQHPNLSVVEVDTDQSPHLSTHFAIRGLPTLILFRNGQEAARQVGSPGSLRALAQFAGVG